MGDGRRVARASRRTRVRPTGVLSASGADIRQECAISSRGERSIANYLSLSIRITRSANNLAGELRGIISRARQYEGGISSRLDVATTRVESSRVFLRKDRPRADPGLHIFARRREDPITSSLRSSARCPADRFPRDRFPRADGRWPNLRRDVYHSVTLARFGSARP